MDNTDCTDRGCSPGAVTPGWAQTKDRIGGKLELAPSGELGIATKAGFIETLGDGAGD